METTETRPFDAWIESSMTRVFPGVPPARTAEQPSVRIRLARGEYQSFQIVLRPRTGRDLRNARIEIGPLTGSTAIDARHIEWRQVGYVHIEHLNYGPLAPNVALAVAAGAQLPGWWPDPLLPVEHFNVAAEFAPPIWVTVYAPPGTPPGECSDTIIIRSDNAEPVTIQPHATVRGLPLPPGAGTFPTAFGLFEDQLERVYGRLDTAMRLQWGDFVLAHRINPGSIHRTDPPVVSALEHWLERGMNAFTVIQNRKSTHRKHTLTESTADMFQKIAAFLEALKQSRHADRLFAMAHVYGFDDLTIQEMDFLRDDFRTVHKRLGLPTLTTSHVPQTPADLRKLHVDWLCPLTSWLKADPAARCRQAGFKTWAYISLEPDPPYAKVRLDCPLIESRVLFWQMYQQQVDGFLYWAFNAWCSEGNDDPIDPAKDAPFLSWNVTSKWMWSRGEQSWLYGDGRPLYPGVHGPIGSIRLANMRDGLQDFNDTYPPRRLLASPSQATWVGKTGASGSGYDLYPAPVRYRNRYLGSVHTNSELPVARCPSDRRYTGTDNFYGWTGTSYFSDTHPLPNTLALPDWNYSRRFSEIRGPSRMVVLAEYGVFDPVWSGTDPGPNLYWHSREPRWNLLMADGHVQFQRVRIQPGQMITSDHTFNKDG
jgi:hypothetical protein